MLGRLQKRLGDILLSEAISKLSKRKAGAPRKWDVSALMELHSIVNVFKLNCKVSKREACRRYARLRKLTLGVVENRYDEGSRRIKALRLELAHLSDEEFSEHIFAFPWPNR